MRIFIGGATGVLGRRLVSRFHAQGQPRRVATKNEETTHA